MDLSKPFLIISDLQIPFEHEKALKFCSYLRDHYSIPNANILNVGDEVDNLAGGLYPKDPDAIHSARGELREAKLKIQEWSLAFPQMKVCISNHGMRWIKKAAAAEIPEQMMRAYQDVLEIPVNWSYAYKWHIPTKHPFQIIHGMELSGKTPYRQAAEMFTISTAFGHLHSSAGVSYVETLQGMRWGFNTGCLIDREAYAFKYAKGHRYMANCGVGVIFNEGLTPLWIPIEAF